MKMFKFCSIALAITVLALTGNASTAMAASRFANWVEATMQADTPGSVLAPTLVSWNVEDASTVVMLSADKSFRIAVPKGAFSAMIQGVIDAAKTCGGSGGAADIFEIPAADHSADKITISAVPGTTKETCSIQFSSAKLKRHVNIGLSEAVFLMMNLSKSLADALEGTNRTTEASPN